MGSFNQPTVASDRYRIGLILGQAGIAALSSSQYTPPAGINLTAAQTTALTSTQSTVQSPTNLNILTNNWVLQNLATQGDFGTDYASRYYIALNGYLQLVASETLYPSYAPAQIGGTSLGAREAYLFTFFGRPPVLPLQGQSGMQGGFWSLTAYGADQFLIPNQLGRYEIGDRSGITYEDGSAVYPSANESSASPANDTKTFQVLLQPQDVTPPANWTKNWLPAPAGGGELLFLRKFLLPFWSCLSHRVFRSSFRRCFRYRRHANYPSRRPRQCHVRRTFYPLNRRRSTHSLRAHAFFNSRPLPFIISHLPPRCLPWLPTPHHIAPHGNALHHASPLLTHHVQPAKYHPPRQSYASSRSTSSRKQGGLTVSNSSPLLRPLPLPIKWRVRIPTGGESRCYNSSCPMTCAAPYPDWRHSSSWSNLCATPQLELAAPHLLLNMIRAKGASASMSLPVDPPT